MLNQRVRHIPTGHVGSVVNDRNGDPVVVVHFDEVPSWNLGKGLAEWAAHRSEIRVADLAPLSTVTRDIVVAGDETPEEIIAGIVAQHPEAPSLTGYSTGRWTSGNGHIAVEFTAEPAEMELFLSYWDREDDSPCGCTNPDCQV